jgi:hypothetical protein
MMEAVHSSEAFVNFYRLDGVSQKIVIYSTYILRQVYYYYFVFLQLRKPRSMKQVASRVQLGPDCYPLDADLFFGLYFDPEDGGDIFLRKLD